MSHALAGFVVMQAPEVIDLFEPALNNRIARRASDREERIDSILERHWKQYKEEEQASTLKKVWRGFWRWAGGNGPRTEPTRANAEATFNWLECELFSTESGIMRERDWEGQAAEVIAAAKRTGTEQLVSAKLVSIAAIWNVKVDTDLQRAL